MVNFNQQTKSIRSFIGAKNYNESREFYRSLGWQESVIDEGMSYFIVSEGIGFYLQKYYVKKWVDNTMMFLEVEDLEGMHRYVKDLNLVDQYEYVRLSEIVHKDWGSEFFLHDPSGVLWHIGRFND
ncbi:VOC family protein [Portibacter marinus]|uniref:hypothetical protein n=1 Tax=Portibacter marinus TaxID=2898660 RepID=UPI001F1678DD|nr:hypothetical protein [Portibacter marinus]